MHRPLLAFLALCGLATLSLAADPVVKCPSPNGRFTLRISDPKEENATPTVELIEKQSGKAVIDLGTSYYGNLEDVVLVWSADSKRFAYATRGPKSGDVSVFLWSGSAFVPATMPETLPDPHINFGKDRDGDVKNYGGAPKPLRWLKSGELLMSNDSVMMSRESGKTYTGTVTFTLSFNKARHATVQNVGKTKTTVD